MYVALEAFYLLHLQMPHVHAERMVVSTTTEAFIALGFVSFYDRYVIYTAYR